MNGEGVNYEAVPGFVLWSNFSPLGAVTGGQIHTLETLTAHMQQSLPQVPLESMLIRRNPILGGWSVYLSEEYRSVCEDFHRGTRELLDLFERAWRQP